MTVMVLLLPVAAENIGAGGLNVFYINESPNFVREWLTMVIRLFEGNRFVSGT